MGQNLKGTSPIRNEKPLLPPPAAALRTRGYLEPRVVCLTRPGDHPVYFPIYTDRSYTFGRDVESDFVLPAETVSRQHGRLSYRHDGRWVYRDLGSTNGSFLSEFLFALQGEPRVKLLPSVGHVVSAGQAVMLSSGGRLSFLLELPPEARGAPEAVRGASGATQALVELMMESALHAMPVFLLGPTGSGKTFCARKIHELSARPGPFESVNCGALSTDADQLRSELLGHVGGAFTGATHGRIGKLRHADGGTLFLDEVESMPPEAQRFLLDVLERTGNFAPLGAPAGREFPAPVFRLIAASKIPLQQSGLRSDLAFRLSRGTVIRMPTLEERREDIPSLVETFLSRLRDEQKVEVRLTDAALGILQRRAWPGHVRELEGIVTAVASRAVARARMKLLQPRRPDDKTQILPAIGLELSARDRRKALGLVEVSEELLAEQIAQHELALGGAAQTPRTPLARKRPGDYLKEEYEAALLAHHGELKATAAELGMSVNTLKAHLVRLGLRPLKA